MIDVKRPLRIQRLEDKVLHLPPGLPRHSERDELGVGQIERLMPYIKAMAILTSMPSNGHTLAEPIQKYFKDFLAPSINGCTLLSGVVHFKDLRDSNGVKLVFSPYPY